MSGLSQRDPPELSEASTGRSKCQRCREPILKGDQRVGMVGRSSSISVRKWMHPNCFATNMRVDYAPTGRAKCTLEPEGDFIAKGEPRFLLRMMTECSDTVKVQQIYRPANAADLVAKFLAVDGVSVTAASINGIDALESDDHRQWMLDVLAGGDVSSRPVPICAAAAAAAAKPPPKPRAPKKKAEAPEGEAAAAPRKKARPAPKAAAVDDGESSAEEID